MQNDSKSISHKLLARSKMSLIIFISKWEKEGKNLETDRNSKQEWYEKEKEQEKTKKKDKQIREGEMGREWEGEK